VTDRPVAMGAILMPCSSRGHNDGFLVTARRPGGARWSWPAEPLLVCDFLAAEVPDSRSSWCEIADVITCPAGPEPDGSAQFTTVLNCYPGCAVAVGIANAGTFMVAARCGSVISLSARGPSGGPSWRALACGSIAYAWLCAGRPLAGLDRFTIRVQAGQLLVGGEGPSCDGAWSCRLWESGSRGSGGGGSGS
jgi:hypothetical protein